MFSEDQYRAIPRSDGRTDELGQGLARAIERAGARYESWIPFRDDPVFGPLFTQAEGYALVCRRRLIRVVISREKSRACMYLRVATEAQLRGPGPKGAA